MNQPSLTQFEQDAALKFQDQSLLQRAFVHRSYLNEAGEDFPHLENERLEFLGDAVLELVASELLFARFPERQEGELTTLRAALVRRETLARFATDLQLGSYLLLGHGEEESGGRTRPATLCATFEAVVGALYLDQGMESVRAFLHPRLKSELNKVERQALDKDAKSRLQEWSQSTLGRTPRYKTISTAGPDHAKLFTLQVSLNKTPVGVGGGRSKQEAAQIAAAMALFRLGQNAPEYESNPNFEELWPLPDIQEALGS